MSEIKQALMSDDLKVKAEVCEFLAQDAQEERENLREAKLWRLTQKKLLDAANTAMLAETSPD